MTTLREAAQQALEAIDQYLHCCFEKETDIQRDPFSKAMDDSRAALRAALAEPQSKPRHVSYVCPQCHWSLEEATTCPPCNGNCNQGRDCPARLSPSKTECFNCASLQDKLNKLTTAVIRANSIG